MHVKDPDSSPDTSPSFRPADLPSFASAVDNDQQVDPTPSGSDDGFDMVSDMNSSVYQESMINEHTHPETSKPNLRSLSKHQRKRLRKGKGKARSVESKGGEQGQKALQKTGEHVDRDTPAPTGPIQAIKVDTSVASTTQQFKFEDTTAPHPLLSTPIDGGITLTSQQDHFGHADSHASLLHPTDHGHSGVTDAIMSASENLNSDLASTEPHKPLLGSVESHPGFAAHSLTDGAYQWGRDPASSPWIAQGQPIGSSTGLSSTSLGFGSAFTKAFTPRVPSTTSHTAFFPSGSVTSPSGSFDAVSSAGESITEADSTDIDGSSDVSMGSEDTEKAQPGSRAAVPTADNDAYHQALAEHQPWKKTYSQAAQGSSKAAQDLPASCHNTATLAPAPKSQNAAVRVEAMPEWLLLRKQQLLNRVPIVAESVTPDPRPISPAQTAPTKAHEKSLTASTSQLGQAKHKGASSSGAAFATTVSADISKQSENATSNIEPADSTAEEVKTQPRPATDSTTAAGTANDMPKYPITPVPVTNKAVLDKDNDLLARLPNTFRLLELYQEQGSGGLVEKILIDQASVVKLANRAQRGTASSIDKLDFARLDEAIVSVRGVFGDREKLAELLVQALSGDEKLKQALIDSDERDTTRPFMRSGLYLMMLPPAHAIVFFWPERTTWDTNAVKNVISNRVTFLRYLTQLADQLYCLIGDDHVQHMTEMLRDYAKHEVESDDEEMDDCYDFAVQKTSQQEERIHIDKDHERTMSLNLRGGPADPPPQGLQADLRPRLVTSIKGFGVMTARYRDGQIETASHYKVSMSSYAVKRKLETSAITLSQDMKMQDVRLLSEHGWLGALPGVKLHWQTLESEAKKKVAEAHKANLEQLSKATDSLRPRFLDAAKDFVVHELARRFPGFDSDLRLESEEDMVTRMKQYSEADLSVMTSALDTIWVSTNLRSALCSPLQDRQWQNGKIALLEALYILQEDPEIRQTDKDNIVSGVQRVIDGVEVDLPKTAKKQSRFRILLDKYQDDGDFLQSLPVLIDPHPELLPSVTAWSAIAQTCIIGRRDDMIQRAADHVHKNRYEKLKNAASTEKKQHEIAEIARATKEYVDWINAHISTKRKEPQSESSIVLKAIQEVSTWSGKSYSVTYDETKTSLPRVLHEVRPFGINEAQLQALASDDSYNPQLEVRCANATHFSLTPDQVVLSFHYLDDRQTKYLLVVKDKAAAKLQFYLSNTGAPARQFELSKVGADCLPLVDLSRREVAIVTSEDLQIHRYRISEDATALEREGEIDLRKWYEGGTRFIQATFLIGQQEIVLVDTAKRVRIYSMVSQQCRPVSLDLTNLDPRSLLSSADGAAFLNTYEDSGSIGLRGYMASSFGARQDGHDLAATVSSSTDIAIFAPASATRMIIAQLDEAEEQLKWTRLILTKETSELQLRSTSSSTKKKEVSRSATSPLLGVFEDMWTRFPIVAAIQRDNLDDLIREPRSITFIEPGAEVGQSELEALWRRMVHDFQQRTNKPTNGILEQMLIVVDTMLRIDTPMSRFRFGQWLVELCCLIPLQLAVAKDKRFIPFNQGKDDLRWEKSLLGADVASVASAISLGWYEAILGRYFRNKPVRVISSLGNQSVGKSYMLNHIANTSFAGAAGRTTEGVWMAVAPTRECVYIMLDFEGVNSPERHPQEDMLLVLFNAALSNMVLFRNHLNVSRELKTMFKAFQHSASVFDPAANPKLFNGKLCMIIKDVIASDNEAAMTEFKQKFTTIVEEEGEQNFVSRLHRNQMGIIPWPVIQDPRFYTHFQKHIVKSLNARKITWTSAGEFVETLKLLEAKLKASDWTSLDASMICQRLNRLRSILPIAIAYGKRDPKEAEPLMDDETGQAITLQGDHIFDSTEMLNGEGSATSALRRMYAAYLLGNPRSSSDPTWRDHFLVEIATAIERRVAMVTAWAKANVRTLPAETNDVVQWRADVKRALEDLQRQYRICSQTCGKCNSVCLLLRGHERNHDCGTDHKCDRPCEYEDDHEEYGQRVSNCSLPAMHEGKHVCDPKAHTCGEACDLEQSCKSRCTRTRDHKIDDEGHKCSARSHICGQTCDFDDGAGYKCSGRCVLAFDGEHSRHECQDRGACPLPCQLCPRLCVEKDHFHGQVFGAIHLCGQEHDCVEQCEKPGICEIQAEPHSIQSTFQGAHSSFEYTKHTQVAKRLKCAKKIPAGGVTHEGSHAHSATNDFHFCEQKCPWCNYYCNLPIGHTQTEHDTSHGSMTATRWAIEDENEIEVDGRKFARGEEGAPMLCNMFCQGQTRHTHIDFCRSQGASACIPDGDHEHIDKRMEPLSDRAKDYVTHNIYWQRANFKDPYPQVDQRQFELCDAQCPGDEHQAADGNPAAPSYCTLPMFHPPSYASAAPPPGGYVSGDGHIYACKNPILQQRAFHIIFVLDRSGSMACRDRGPMRDAPSYRTISRRSDDRYGAVLSACYSFWSSREAVIASSGPGAARRDAYSVILFNESPTVVIANDYQSSADQLLDTCLAYSAGGGTNFAAALDSAQQVMLQNWAPERTPVIIFLSDGECSIQDHQMYPICRQAVAQGKALNLHSVSFGSEYNSVSLNRMADIGKEVYRGAPRDPLAPPGDCCSFSNALDTVTLASTFLGIADSLKKPRGSLVSF